MTENDNYKKAYERQKLARARAEDLLERRSRELFETNETLSVAFHDLQNQKEQMVLQEKLASIGLLAAGVAHEINNPVAFIRSNLDTLHNYFTSIKLILDTYKALEVKIENSAHKTTFKSELDCLKTLAEEHELNYIKEDAVISIEESLVGTKRVEDIVRNLKGFSRNDKDERRKTNINECIDSSINLVWNEIKYKCEIERHYQEIPEIYACTSQLNQIFNNILLNASHAIEETGTIEIHTSADAANVQIVFIDNGTGIPEANLNKLFDPFYSTKDVGKGTGLGLYVSHGLVQKHQGTITASNNPGKGARLQISLPIDMRESMNRRHTS
ncbi:MAG: two-component system NtrC family sensor kinase [Kiritimatiellia bacterium]|jgi:two-component system NtrC family sensor kinase